MTDADGRIARGVIDMRPPPAGLTPFVLSLVRRDENVDGGVVRILPELRASIQIQHADPYFVRNRDPGAVWIKTPRIALWQPRFEWAYGYVARRVRAFAIGLTPAGYRAIAPRGSSRFYNGVADLCEFDPSFAGAIDPHQNETFEAWVARITPPLFSGFAAVAPSPDFGASLQILATGEGGAIARAAAAAGMSERQFRRVFEEQFGAGPKRYQRALRVDRMLRRLHPAPWEKDAIDGAIAFADQPHAIREFRAMTGMTPREYAAAKEDGDRTLRSISVEGVAPPNDDAHAAARY